MIYKFITIILYNIYYYYIYIIYYIIIEKLYWYKNFYIVKLNKYVKFNNILLLFDLSYIYIIMCRNLDITIKNTLLEMRQ